MAYKFAAQSFLQKLKLLLIVVSLGSIVTWLATSNVQVLVKEIHYQPLMPRFWKITNRSEERMASVCPPCPPKLTPTASHLPLCPFLTPYLHGATKLTFDVKLTLAEVQKKNPKVQKGMFAPQECHPLQRVAILIPHRNREKHLLYLLEHLHPFLQRQLLDYGIYVINQDPGQLVQLDCLLFHQAGNGRFNRAKLLNVGFLEALKEREWDCFIFHDVDLLPENDFNLYLCDNVPKHLVVGRNVTGYRIRYAGYFGGVTALTTEQFKQVNGFSNRYWGWGGEDDDLRIRIQLQKMKFVRPPIEIARYTMTFHTRDQGNEVNRDRMKLLSEVSQRWRKDGLNSCSYSVISQHHNPLYINITVDVGDSHRSPEVVH